MKIRFYNARILSMDQGLNIIDGELWTEDDRIYYIGSKPPEHEVSDREIDVKRDVIMPGFKNAHAHSPMTFARSLADELPLAEWLQTKIFPLEALLTAEDIYYFTKLAHMEYLAGGVTAVFDMYYEPEAMAKATIETGLRTVLCGGMNDFKDSIQELEEFYLKYNQYDELVSYKLGFHAEYTTSYESIRKIGKLAEKYEAPVFVHNSETLEEVRECKKRHRMSPTQLFDELGIYNYGGGGFHCIYVDEADMQILHDKKVWVITNPASNLKLASGLAPLADLMRMGIEVTIGTDGSASNNSLDMFREMYLAATLQKFLEKNASICPAKEILQMATVKSAIAMGLYESDILQAGKKADLIILSLHQPNMQPLNDILNNIVYSGNKSNVRLTMVNGKILYEDGVFHSVDADEIYTKCNRLLVKLKQKVMN